MHRNAAQPPACAGRERGLSWAALGVANAVMAAAFLSSRASGTSAAWTGFPLDDAWIHLVYARSLATLDGFAYNPGVPEAGFTSPLWALLLVPAVWLEKLDVPLVPAVKALGVAVGWATSVLALRVVRRLTGSAVAAWTAALLVCLEPWLGFARVSGMEVLLASATALLVLDALASERLALASVALALAGWARPENALLVALAAPLVAALAWRRGGPRGAALAIAPAVVAAAAWVGWCLHATGRALPNTFYAKHAGADAERLASSLRVLAITLAEAPALWGGVGVALALLGAAAALRRAASPGPAGARGAAALLVLHPVAFLAAIAWVHRLDQTAFYWSRYALPALPFVLALVGAGTGALAGRAWPALVRAGAPLPARAAAALALVACAIPWVRTPAAVRERAALYSGNCENVNEMQVEAARWVRANVPPGRAVAVIDAGAMRFFGEHPVVDLVGLNTHEVLESGFEAVVAARPACFVTFPAAGYQAMPGMQLVHAIAARRLTICDCPSQAEMLVLRPPAWVSGDAAR